MWNLIYYETASGRCPVKEYLDSLDAVEAAKVTPRKRLRRRLLKLT